MLFSPSTVYTALAAIFAGCTTTTRGEFLLLLRIGVKEGNEGAIELSSSTIKDHLELAQGDHIVQAVGAFFDSYYVTLKSDFEKSLRVHRDEHQPADPAAYKTALLEATFDHPFFFTIHSPTGVPICVGLCTDPDFNP